MRRLCVSLLLLELLVYGYAWQSSPPSWRRLSLLRNDRMGSAECSDEDIIDFYKKQLDEQKRINDQLLDALASTSAALRSATATNNQLMSLSQPAWEDRGAEHKGTTKFLSWIENENVCVHLVGVVAATGTPTRRGLSIALEPPLDPTNILGLRYEGFSERRTWGETWGCNSKIEVKVKLGPALMQRLGRSRTIDVMKSMRVGQKLYIVGITERAEEEELSEDKASKTVQLHCVNLRLLEEVEVNGPIHGKNWDSRVQDALHPKAKGAIEKEPVPFQTGLQVPWKGLSTSSEGFMSLDLSPSDVVVVDNVNALNSMAAYLQNLHSSFLRHCTEGTAHNDGLDVSSLATPVFNVLSLDCEWQPERHAKQRHRVSLLQLATRRKVFVVDMLWLCEEHTTPNQRMTRKEETFSRVLTPIFRSKSVLKVALGPKHDLRKLAASYPHMSCFSLVKNSLCLEEWARLSFPESVPKKLTQSLSKLCELVLGAPLSKAQQRSNWGKRPLTKTQVEYAALDAFIIPAIFDTIAFHSASAAMPLDRRITSILQDFEAKDLEKSIAKHKPSHMPAPVFDTAKVKAPHTPASPVSPHLDFKNMSIDVDLVVRRWFGKPLPTIGKDAVIEMLLSTAATRELDASFINGKLIYFNRHDRFTEFQNAVALFVNIDYSADDSSSTKILNHKHPGHYHYLDGSSFIYCRDVSPPVPGGKRYETKMPDYLLEWMIKWRWFDEPTYQTTLLSEEEGQPPSASKKSILLFCRMPGQPFVFCGRIGQPEVIQTYVNNMYFPSISFKLIDYEHTKLRERPRLSELWYSAPQERYTVDN